MNQYFTPLSRILDTVDDIELRKSNNRIIQCSRNGSLPERSINIEDDTFQLSSIRATAVDRVKGHEALGMLRNFIFR